MINEKYTPQEIESKWQGIWEERKVFKAPDPSVDPLKRPKYYCLCMFPYPSGSIHMGHLRNYCIGDVISRFKRMQGFNVMQPVGWDAFGLPAENAAIQRNIHPRDWTIQNIAQMKGDFKTMGIAYDWDREIATCLPDYYRWEQFFFRKFFEEGLAYKKKGLLNWCAHCETVLANEQVQDGRCWRCDSEVTMKELSQWFLRTTLFADQLLSDHKELQGFWPDRVLEMQKHWIGESHGCRIRFLVESAKAEIEVFTTRPDTLFGVTFLTISALHPLAEKLTTQNSAQLATMQKEAKLGKGLADDDKKEGFFTGSYCVHPLTNEKIPVWVGNFVVMEYGTGAVMGVPAHDERDFEFATKYGLAIKTVIAAEANRASAENPTAAFTEPGVLVESGPFTGQPSEGAKKAIAHALEKVKKGTPTIQYRLRDWGISRQRYWGTPIPVIYCEDCGPVLVPEKDLPVELPYDVKFTGKGGNPLEKHEIFVNAPCPKCAKPGRRETDTMDTFVESSWYYARYVDPKNDQAPFSKKRADEWLPVDSYIGGIEHACMHLLYSRFFHKVLRDWGFLSGNEPFARLLSQGMVIKDGAKMSKSKGNVVALTTLVERFGADTGRLFSLFAAPPEKDLEWNEKGVEGCHRFLTRIWRLFSQFQSTLAEPQSDEKSLAFSPSLLKVRRKTHWMIQKMSENLETHKYNTAIAASMELVNEFYQLLSEHPTELDSEAGAFVLREGLRSLVLCLAPFAPHVCEELWSALGPEKGKDLVSTAAWPVFRPELIAEESFTLVIQINGKVREKISMRKGLSKEEIQKEILALPRVQHFLEGKPVKQFIYVPERIANLVVG